MPNIFVDGKQPNRIETGEATGREKTPAEKTLIDISC